MGNYMVGCFSYLQIRLRSSKAFFGPPIALFIILGTIKDDYRAFSA